MALIKKFCKECGSEILIVRSLDPFEFYTIDEIGELQKEEENSIFEEVSFKCSNDSQHSIGDDEDMAAWQRLVIEKLRPKLEKTI